MYPAPDSIFCFNTQPPEGGWIPHIRLYRFSLVSTHSRLKAAGNLHLHPLLYQIVSTHSRLKAAGANAVLEVSGVNRFNTQPPEGGWLAAVVIAPSFSVSTHSRLKAAGGLTHGPLVDKAPFQHTAA